MISVFWVLTIILVIFATGFSLAKMHSRWVAFFIFITITTLSYTLYLSWGSSQYLAEYYSPESELLRQKHKAFRPLLAEFIKEEFRLSARLARKPKKIQKLNIAYTIY